MIMTATTTTRSFDDAFLKVGPMLAEDGVGAGEGDFSPVGSDSGLLFDGGGI